VNRTKPFRKGLCFYACALEIISRAYPPHIMSETTALKQNSTKTEFLHFIHSFRGVAILFVIGGHVLLEWEPGTISESILNAILRNGTVLFVFIAGYLFQYLSNKYETMDYWKKKLQYVLIPYVLISIPALLLRFIETPRVVLLENPDYPQWSALHKVFYYYSTGAHLQPLWFVPMIILFYLAAPVLVRGDRSGWLYRLLPLFIIVSLAVSRDQLSDIPRMFVHFFSVYAFGMFFSRYRSEIFEVSEKWWIVFTVLALGLCAFTCFDNPYYDQSMYLQKMSFCWLFIYWLREGDRFVPKFFDTLAELSFGIFFLHYYFLLAFKFVAEKYAPIFMEGNVFNWFIHFVLIVTSNTVFLIVMKKILSKNSRYLVGA
jgi:peptidoglycan/LPS O-acetylase OafA/YrhL